MGSLGNDRALRERIDARWKANQQSGHRPHLGASSIGKDCTRKLWYDFHWFPRKAWEGRMLRLVDRGKREEHALRELLAAEGFVFLDSEESQLQVSMLNGHFGGSCDGLMEPPDWWSHQERMILEMKTSNTKQFQHLADTIRIAKPEHYAQMQVYMHGLGVKHGLYMAVNKDNDELYFEEVAAVERDYAELERKANFVIMSSAAPQRISENPSYYRCKMCDSNEYCRNKAALTGPNCRNCIHSQPIEKGQWQCKFWEDVIPKETMPVGCEEHAWRV